MKSYYFTFGSDEKFPFQNTYLIISGVDTMAQAINVFRSFYPDRDRDIPCYNASDCYSKDDWYGRKFDLYYKHVPAEQITITRKTEF